MEEKLNYYLIIITSLALAISTFCIIQDRYILFVLVFFGLYLLDNRHRFKPALITVDIIAIVSFPIILLTEYLIFGKGSDTSAIDQFLTSTMLSIIVLIVPFSLFYNHFIKVLIVANHEKDHFELINSYPNVICKSHHAKAEQYTTLGFKTIHCRKSKKCFAQGNVKALNLVGLIGDLNDGEEHENDYYVTLWDYKNNKIIDADYDIIEIQESEKIEDYDSVINKIITFFYNEIGRFKPIDKVIIRINGNPQISESTKRLLKERFFRVEYIID